MSKGIHATDRTEIKEEQAEGHRQIIVDFEKYAKKKKKGLIEKYNLEQLIDVINEHNVEHGHIDWFKEIEKRIKVLKKRKK